MCAKSILSDVDDEVLLREVEDVIRSMPQEIRLGKQTLVNWEWLGRAAAVCQSSGGHGAWQGPRLIEAMQTAAGAGLSGTAFARLMVLLQMIRSDLRLKTTGPMSVAIGQGRYFDYFDEVRKVIELATSDVLFVDPYLEAEFVSRYLPHVRSGAAIRLLAGKALPQLMSAVEQFARQSMAKIEVRSSVKLHDRFVFIDGSSCYQSGASFKDGARNSSTTLTQITDAFVAVQGTYEALWGSGKVELKT